MRFGNWLIGALIIGYLGLGISYALFIAPLNSVMMGYPAPYQFPVWAMAPQVIYPLVLMLAMLPLAILMEAAEILTSKKQWQEQLLWLAGLFFFTPIVPAAYWLLGRKDLSD